jgi:hypothetical protein
MYNKLHFNGYMVVRNYLWNLIALLSSNGYTSLSLVLQNSAAIINMVDNF